MSGISNYELEQLTFKLIGKKTFLGVFPADELKNVPSKKIFCIIFNTDKIHGPGKHFVSIYATAKKLHYFDSFGKSNIQTDIAKFISNSKRKCVMHCLSIQDPSSNFCGFFALAFLLWMKEKNTSLNFYKLFNKNNLKCNNSIVTKFILKKIK